MIRCPDFEPAAQIIPDRDAQFVTRLRETEKKASRQSRLSLRVPALTLRRVTTTANVIFRTVGVERDFRAGPDTISSSALLACSRASRRSSVASASTARRYGRSVCATPRPSVCLVSIDEP